jgi:hypothetical protein
MPTGVVDLDALGICPPVGCGCCHPTGVTSGVTAVTPP